MAELIEPFADINSAILKLGQTVLILRAVQKLTSFLRQIKLFEDFKRQGLLSIQRLK